MRTFVESNVLYIEKALIRSCKIAESEVARDLYPYESRGSNGRRRLDWGINDGARLMSIEVNDTYSIQHCAVTQRADKYTSHNSYNSSFTFLSELCKWYTRKKEVHDIFIINMLISLTMHINADCSFSPLHTANCQYLLFCNYFFCDDMTWGHTESVSCKRFLIRFSQGLINEMWWQWLTLITGLIRSYCIVNRGIGDIPMSALSDINYKTTKYHE